MTDAQDFTELNAALKDAKGSAELTVEEKSDISELYKTEAKRLKQAPVPESQTQASNEPEKPEEQPKAQGRVPGF